MTLLSPKTNRKIPAVYMIWHIFCHLVCRMITSLQGARTLFLWRMIYAQLVTIEFFGKYPSIFRHNVTRQHRLVSESHMNRSGTSQITICILTIY